MPSFHARNCNIKIEKESKDERRARLDEKIYGMTPLAL